MVFFAVLDVSDNLKDFFALYNKGLNNISGLNVVSPFKIHLTLASFSFIDEAELVSKFKKIKFKPFYVETDKFGFFPDKDSIKVIWLGVKNSSNLSLLKSKLGGRARFTPHITVARANSLTSRSKEKLLKMLKKPNMKFKVSGFKLYSLEKSSFGHIFTLVQSFKFE